MNKAIDLESSNWINSGVTQFLMVASTSLALCGQALTHDIYVTYRLTRFFPLFTEILINALTRAG